jgi:hypothetical protein
MQHSMHGRRITYVPVQDGRLLALARAPHANMQPRDTERVAAGVKLRRGARDRHDELDPNRAEALPG